MLVLKDDCSGLPKIVITSPAPPPTTTLLRAIAVPMRANPIFPARSVKAKAQVTGTTSRHWTNTDFERNQVHVSMTNGFSLLYTHLLPISG